VTAPVFVVSSGRPAAVERMMPLLDGLEVRWCVPEGQGDTYRMAGELVGTGDIEVVEVPEPTREFDAMLAAQRNAVLAYAEASGWPRVVQINDDLRTSSRTDTGFTVARIQPPDEASEQVITAATAIEFICVEMDSRGAHFGGCAPTTNLFFQAAKRAVGTEHFIMAQLMVIDVGDGLRFPYEMGTKEDYDFTLQHLYRYGVVARCDRVLGWFSHFEKRGGCGPYRSVTYDTEMARILMQRWPDDIVTNVKRGPQEVLLRWSGQRDAEGPR
jgi:hypothetical protein